MRFGRGSGWNTNRTPPLHSSNMSCICISRTSSPLSTRRSHQSIDMKYWYLPSDALPNEKHYHNVINCISKINRNTNKTNYWPAVLDWVAKYACNLIPTIPLRLLMIGKFGAKLFRFTSFYLSFAPDDSEKYRPGFVNCIFPEERESPLMGYYHSQNLWLLL